MSALIIKDLQCGYAATPVITVGDLVLSAGDALTVVGPNGSGKSTLLKTLCASIPAVRGEVSVGDHSIHRMSTDIRARHVSMLMQMQPLDPGFSVLELVGLGRTPYLGRFGHFSKEDEFAVDEAIRICDLETLRDKPLGQISGGERQRARFAMVLAQHTPLVLLDEPTNHMDVSHRYMLHEIVTRIRKERGVAVIMVSHSLEDSQRFGDRTMLVNQGGVKIFAKEEFGQLKEAIVESARVPADWVY